MEELDKPYFLEVIENQLIDNGKVRIKVFRNLLAEIVTWTDDVLASNIILSDEVDNDTEGVAASTKAVKILNDLKLDKIQEQGIEDRIFQINGDGTINIIPNKGYLTNSPAVNNKATLTGSGTVSDPYLLLVPSDESDTLGGQPPSYYVSQSQLATSIATSAYGIKYIFDNQTERDNQVGMVNLEQGLQQDNRTVYKYNGTTWEILYTLDSIHNHNDIYYTQTQIDNLLSNISSDVTQADLDAKFDKVGGTISGDILLNKSGDSSIGIKFIDRSGENSEDFAKLHLKGLDGSQVKNLSIIIDEEGEERQLATRTWVEDNTDKFPGFILTALSKDSLAPSTTQNIFLEGVYLTPTTTVTIQDITINSISFPIENEMKRVLLNVTTSATLAEGLTIIVDNGTPVTLTQTMNVRLGTLYEPDVVAGSDMLMTSTMASSLQMSKGSIRCINGSGGYKYIRCDNFDINSNAEWVLEWRLSIFENGEIFFGMAGVYPISGTGEGFSVRNAIYTQSVNASYGYVVGQSGNGANLIAITGQEVNFKITKQVSVTEEIYQFYVDDVLKRTATIPLRAVEIERLSMTMNALTTLDGLRFTLL